MLTKFVDAFCNRHNKTILGLEQTKAKCSRPKGSEGVTKCHCSGTGTKLCRFQPLEVAHPQIERVELKFLHKSFPIKLLAVAWHFVAATLPLGHLGKPRL